jgi:dipeptidyl aminopeptidase/acylaminoacyl peptidase
LHGEADESVPLKSARELAEWATRLGGRVTFQVYPGEGHRQSYWREQSAMDAFKRTLTFFRDELKSVDNR